MKNIFEGIGGAGFLLFMVSFMLRFLTHFIGILTVFL